MIPVEYSVPSAMIGLDVVADGTSGRQLSFSIVHGATSASTTGVMRDCSLAFVEGAGISHAHSCRSLFESTPSSAVTDLPLVWPALTLTAFGLVTARSVTSSTVSVPLISTASFLDGDTV